MCLNEMVYLHFYNIFSSNFMNIISIVLEMIIRYVKDFCKCSDFKDLQ